MTGLRRLPDDQLGLESPARYRGAILEAGDDLAGDELAHLGDRLTHRRQGRLDDRGVGNVVEARDPDVGADAQSELGDRL